MKLNKLLKILLLFTLLSCKQYKCEIRYMSGATEIITVKGKPYLDIRKGVSWFHGDGHIPNVEHFRILEIIEEKPKKKNRRRNNSVPYYGRSDL